MAENGAQDREAFQMVIGGHLIGFATTNLIALGDKLGLYKTMKELGHATPAQLAKKAGLHERYVREWCYQQASAKVICCDKDAATFWLSPAQQDVLANEHGEDASPWFFIGGFDIVPGMAHVAAEKLPHCFKTGEGLSYNDIDQRTTCGICRELGVWARHALVGYLGNMPGMKELLDKGAKVADVGCGCGEALLVLARAFPASSFTGYDISELALKVARERAEAEGLSNVTFLNPGVDDERLPAEPTFDLIQTHDAVHDMAHPHKVIPHVLAALKPGAPWIIGDITSMDTQAETIHSHPLAPLLYGFSCHLCLPSGLSAPGGLGLGTTGLPKPAMTKMLKEAGFSRVDVLDWQHPLNTYYKAVKAEVE